MAGAEKTRTGKTGKEFDKTMAEFRTLYKEALAKDKMVGSSFRFIRGDEVLAEELSGLANVEENRKIDEKSLFHWASITKTLTGIAIMQLRDRRQLSLDDPIIDYVPELSEVHDPYGEIDDITIRHLMTHSRVPQRHLAVGRQAVAAPRTDALVAAVAMMLYTEIEFAPGTERQLPHPGIVFLGRVIERMTADDWEVYMDKNVCSRSEWPEELLRRHPVPPLEGRDPEL